MYYNSRVNKKSKKLKKRFSRPNGFVVGLASAFDLSGALSLRLNDLYRGETNNLLLDKEALAGDWRRIGEDIRSAIMQNDPKTK
jgi:hypothetical protein